MIQPVALRAVRLVKPFRGRPAGFAMRVTSREAERLLASGVAVEASDSEVPAGQTAERAVAGMAVEVRHAW